MKTTIKRKISFFLALAVCLLFAPCLYAQSEEEPIPVNEAEKQLIIDSVSANYTAWDRISMTGKLSSPMLPLTASVKVYMEKGKLVVITVSAPLVGEAARIEIDPEQSIVVNKMKNTFATVRMEEIEPMFPGGLEMIQNLLLGRVTILGNGELNSSDADKLQIYSASEEDWMLLPDQDIENAPYVYLYLLDKENLELDRFTVLAQNGEGEADCFYARDKKTTTIDMSAGFGSKGLNATLRLNNPDASPKPIQRFDPTSKYRQTDLKGVMK